MSFSAGIVSGLMVVGDACAIVGPAWAIYLAYVGWDDDTLPAYAAPILLNAILALLVFQLNGLYRFKAVVEPAPALRRLLFLYGFVFLLLVTMAFALKISTEYSRVWLFSWFLSSAMLLVTGRLVAYRLILSQGRSGRLTRNIAVIGAGAQGRRLLERLETQSEPWNRVIGVFDDRQGRAVPEINGYPYLGTVDDLVAEARQRRIDSVILALPWYADHRLEGLIRRLKELPVSIHLGSDLIGYSFAPRDYVQLCRAPLFEISPKPLSGWQRVTKLIEDKILAALLLVLAAPLMLLIAAAIRLETPGPILFRQARYGFNNKVFDVYKFRTMHHDRPPEGSVPQARRDDPRVTRVGRFLRRTSLDELPQLLNVLQGTMSLVGPRPHAVVHNEAYAAIIDGYFGRHRMKPGITGWAQINGLRGETDTPDKMRARVEHDIHYVENWSLLFDLQILAVTPFVGLVHRNAY